MRTTTWIVILTAALTLIGCGAPTTETDSASEEPTTDAPVETPAAETETRTPGEQANADFQDRLAGAELLAALQQGGHVIYFRHAQTERDYADQADPSMSLDDCETQRKLSEAGIQDAKDIGAAFTDKQIPVDQVIASQYCRAWQTADLAFGRHEQNPALNFLPFEEYTEEQVAEMKANLTPLLVETPESGANTVIVGHDDLFEAATGIYPEPQGIAYVLTPDGAGAFELVANLLPAEWADL